METSYDDWGEVLKDHSPPSPEGELMETYRILRNNYFVN